MASWHPRKLGQWFQAPSPEDGVVALHQERVHLDPLGEGQLSQLVVNGWRQVDGLLDRRRLSARRGRRVAGLQWLSRDVHFISGLMAHKTPFLVAELGPDVKPFL
jgi:hypothetical protein